MDGDAEGANQPGRPSDRDEVVTYLTAHRRWGESRAYRSTMDAMTIAPRMAGRTA